MRSSFPSHSRLLSTQRLTRHVSRFPNFRLGVSTNFPRQLVSPTYRSSSSVTTRSSGASVRLIPCHGTTSLASRKEKQQKFVSVGRRNPLGPLLLAISSMNPPPTLSPKPMPPRLRSTPNNPPARRRNVLQPMVPSMSMQRRSPSTALTPTQTSSLREALPAYPRGPGPPCHIGGPHSHRR